MAQRPLRKTLGIKGLKGQCDKFLKGNRHWRYFKQQPNSWFWLPFEATKFYGPPKFSNFLWPSQIVKLFMAYPNFLISYGPPEFSNFLWPTRNLRPKILQRFPHSSGQRRPSRKDLVASGHRHAARSGKCAVNAVAARGRLLLSRKMPQNNLCPAIHWRIGKWTAAWKLYMKYFPPGQLLSWTNV